MTTESSIGIRERRFRCKTFVLRDLGEDRLAVRGHALMDAMYCGRAVDEGVHRYRYQHVKRVKAVRIGGWDRVVIGVLPLAEPLQPVERTLDAAAAYKLQYIELPD
jgi:hypothetical protein